MLAGAQGFESWWGFVVCFWAHSGVYVCICMGECVHIHLCWGAGECEHVSKHKQIRVDTENLASLHHVHVRVYGCPGVSSAPNRRERSLKSGLCPPLHGALPVPGTVLGRQLASINTGGMASGAGTISTSSAISAPSSAIIGGAFPGDPIQLGHPMPSLNQALSAKQLAEAIPGGQDEVGAGGHTPSLRVLA